MATKKHIPRQNTHALKEISVSIIIALFFKILFSAQMALLFFFLPEPYICIRNASWMYGSNTSLYK